MYKAVFNIQSGCISHSRQEIFTPFINCYDVHSVTIHVNGQVHQEERSFKLNGEKTVWFGGFTIDGNDSVVFDINYFYIRPENVEALGFVINGSYIDQSKSKEIVSKHYIDGQFSLDNGLYKNAVMNFGTVLEGLLNTELNSTKLVRLINGYSGDANKDAMHWIRKLRNKVHPNMISETEDVSRTDAVAARDHLELILRTIH